MRILSIDAWAGTESNTWEWNQWFDVGNFPEEMIDNSDGDILQWLRENDLLNKGVGLNMCYIDDDQYNKVVTRKRDHKPLFAIEYGNNF